MEPAGSNFSLGGLVLEIIHDGEEVQTALLVSVDIGDLTRRPRWMSLPNWLKQPALMCAVRLCKSGSPDKATCIGTGRLEEIAEICENAEIPLIFDLELTSTQLRNIEEITGCRVIDRTMLILDIFAARARSAEGRIGRACPASVSSAAACGKGAQLSRLGGGIGTRGPGETKLETDRRHIRKRIKALREQLRQIESRRRPPLPSPGWDSNRGTCGLHQRRKINPDEQATDAGCWLRTSCLPPLTLPPAV